MELTKYQKEILKVAQLSVADLPKSFSELNKMIWDAYNTGLEHGKATNDRTAFLIDCLIYIQDRLITEKAELILSHDAEEFFEELIGYIRETIKKMESRTDL